MVVVPLRVNSARNLHFAARQRPMRYALANMDWKNKLYFGDNLKILRQHVADASASVIPAKAGIHLGKLIYLDPPFNSSATYPSADGLFKEKSGEESAAPTASRKEPSLPRSRAE
jgi:hypothetical protein